MTHPKVSIIFTSYNVEKYVRQSLLSICHQTLNDIQIIVIDDGSKDKTPAILNEIALLDPRIHLILLEKNTIGGVATAANLGMDAALGDYIGFADGDDIYNADTFEKLYNSAEKYSSDIVICKYDDFDDATLTVENSSDTYIWDHLPPEDFIVPNIHERTRLLSLSPVPWRKLYKKSFIDRHHLRFPEVDYYFEDNPFHWAVILNCQTVSFVREVLCHHRLNRTGQTMSSGNLKSVNIFNHFQKINSYCDSFLEKINTDSNINTNIKHNNAKNLLSVQLLRWITVHCYWTAEMVGIPNHHAVAAASQPLLIQFSKDEVLAAYSNNTFNQIDLRVIYSLKTNNLAMFKRIITGAQPTIISLIFSKIHYLGYKQTLSLILNYIHLKTRKFDEKIKHLHWEVNQVHNNLELLSRRTLLLKLINSMKSRQSN
jgi:glycosyltransferase involved in cell wall biosynthesis